MDVLSRLTHIQKKMADDWNVIDWRAGDLSKLGTQITMSYETATNDANATFTPSIVAQASPPNNAQLAVPKMRIENLSGQAGGNTRRCFPIVGSTCKNGEMRALMLGRFRTSSADQVSLMFRQQPDAANSNQPWAFVFWPDGIFGVESLWNIDWWRHGPTGALVQGVTTTSGGGSYDMPGLQVYRPISMGSKIGTAVTLQLGANHGIVTGDSLAVQGEEYDEGTVTVTSASQVQGTVKFTSGISAASPIYNVGIGRVMSRSIMPYWIAGRIVDDIFQGKGWLLGDAEPDWDSANNAVRMVNPTTGTGAGPQTAGLMGIGAAHLTNASHYVDYLSVFWRSLD